MPFFTQLIQSGAEVSSTGGGEFTIPVWVVVIFLSILAICAVIIFGFFFVMLWEMAQAFSLWWHQGNHGRRQCD